MDFFERLDYDINEQLSLEDNFRECLEHHHIFYDDRNGPDVYNTYTSMFRTCVREELEQAWQRSTLQGLQLLYQIFVIYDESRLPHSIPAAALALIPFWLGSLVLLP